MDDTLKRNLRKTGIFMLVTACLPCFYLLGFCMNNAGAYWLCFAIAYWGYFPSGVITLLWGCITIWQFPFEKIRRALLLIAWLLFYPILCGAWLLLFVLVAGTFLRMFIERNAI